MAQINRTWRFRSTPYGCKKEDTPPEGLPPEPFQGIIKRLFTTLAYSGMGEPWETLGSMGTHV